MFARKRCVSAESFDSEDLGQLGYLKIKKVLHDSTKLTLGCLRSLVDGGWFFLPRRSLLFLLELNPVFVHEGQRAAVQPDMLLRNMSSQAGCLEDLGTSLAQHSPAHER